MTDILNPSCILEIFGNISENILEVQNPHLSAGIEVPEVDAVISIFFLNPLSDSKVQAGLSYLLASVTFSFHVFLDFVLHASTHAHHIY